ncbi:MAG: hypothetical protein ACRC5H_01060 [Treponemataceae bacterium]
MNTPTIITRKDHYKDYEKLLFCIKALGKTDDPLFTRYLHIENSRVGSRVITTDGKRLHLCKTHMKLPQGNFIPILNNYTITLDSSVDIPFPSWKNIIPENPDYKGVLNLEELGADASMSKDEKFTSVYCHLLSTTGFNINIKYVKDLPKINWNVFTKKGKNNLIILKNKKDEECQQVIFVPVRASA